MTDLEGEFMRPEVFIRISPDTEGDYVHVTVSVTGKTDDGVEHWTRIYEQLRIAQQLPDSMAVEPWLLASLAEHTDAIRAALAMRINQGAKTFMVDTYVPRRDESVGTGNLAPGRQ